MITQLCVPTIFSNALVCWSCICLIIVTSKFVDAGGYNREGGIEDLEWVDREGWRKKIIP